MFCVLLAIVLQCVRILIRWLMKLNEMELIWGPPQRKCCRKGTGLCYSGLIWTKKFALSTALFVNFWNWKFVNGNEIITNFDNLSRERDIWTDGWVPTQQDVTLLEWKNMYVLICRLLVYWLASEASRRIWLKIWLKYTFHMLISLIRVHIDYRKFYLAKYWGGSIR